MKLNRSYERTTEFRERQGNLFDSVALVVCDLAASVRSTLRSWAAKFFAPEKITVKAPQQLSLLLQMQFHFSS